MRLIETMEPVAGRALEVHHGDDDYALGLIAVNDGVREVFAEKPAGILREEPMTLRRETDFSQAAFDLKVETLTERRIDFGVVAHALRIFVVSLTLKDVGFHSPTILRTFARVTSPGINSALPLSISASRRWTSSCQA